MSTGKLILALGGVVTAALASLFAQGGLDAPGSLTRAEHGVPAAATRPDARAMELARAQSPTLAAGLDAAANSTPSETQALVAVPPSGRFGLEVPSEGRTARLTGTISVDGSGARATLRFLAGPNAGAELVTETDGRYDWTGLYPGFGLLSVDAGYRCTRELVLRHRRSDTYDLALGDLGTVLGRLVDEQGEPVVGAPLELDGNPGASGRDGVFELPRQAPGPALLIVRQPGFVPYCERIQDGMGTPGGRPLEVELQRGGSFELSLGPVPGGTGEVLVWLLPTAGQRYAGSSPQAAYPWHELNPLRMQPGEVRLLTDMPLSKLDALAFHPRAKGGDFVWLVDTPVVHRDTARLEVDLEPLPEAVVRVVRDGEPVPGATVLLRFPNRMAASLGAFGPVAAKRMNAQPLAILPAARQLASTGPDGRCVLGLDEAVRGTPYVTVTSPGGLLEITRPLKLVDGEMLVDLADPAGG